jgi:peptidoglycan/xylan/chitin deacetylase (PgdA/CDA1 family)
MITLISLIVDIILRQRRTRRGSESPVSYSETSRILISAVIANNPPSEVTRGSRNMSSCQGAISAVLSNPICFNLTNIVRPVGWFAKAIEGLLRTFTTSGTPQRRIAHAFIAFIIGIPGFHSLTVYAAAPYTPAPFTRGLVSITFDDGYASQYTNALQKLLTRQLKATFYIISSEVDDQPLYMTAAQLIDLHNNGMEIGSHSVTHPDMTTLSQEDLINEMSQSQVELQNAIPGAPVRDFAYPGGSYNANTIAIGRQYYQSQRCSDDGFNTRNNLNLTRLKIKSVENGITPDQVKAWIDQANMQKTWLILLYHKIDSTLPLPDGDQYATLPSDLDTELQYIKDSGIGVVTVDQAIKETAPQL